MTSSSSGSNENKNEDASNCYFPLKFLPFSSTVESPFWVQYCHMKLETIKLNEEPISLVATYGVGDQANAAGRLQLVESSLIMINPNVDREATFPNDRVLCQGSLRGLNTLEAFSKVDKNQLLKEKFGVEFFQTGKTKCLNPFQVVTFADLKQHKVLYWFGFPALMCQTTIHATLTEPSQNQQHPVWCGLPQQFHSFRWNLLMKMTQDETSLQGLPPYFVATSTQMLLLTDLPKVLQLLQESKNVKDEVLFGFIDPTQTLSSAAAAAAAASSDNEQQLQLPPMGWPLRNLIAFLSFHCQLGGSKVSIVSWRAPLRRLELSTSRTTTSASSSGPPELSPEMCASTLEHLLLLEVNIPSMQDYIYASDAAAPEATSTSTSTSLMVVPQDDNDNDASNIKVVGWELNARLKPGPRWVNLKPLLDSTHLAIQAADLNLKLMKWRMIPSLQVERLQATKVLLLGAGTLGCSVARTLLGWGIRKFTLLDNGTVSYSNPCRQNLFTLEDCHYNNGAGKPKAQAAAEALQKIAADVQAIGVHLSIPMPGHMESKEDIQESVTKLDQWIQDCDVVYLLTDTRESRWLPTLMAAAHNKILINAALGLDSWLVMRHGGSPTTNTTITTGSTTAAAGGDEPDGGTRLGCYFCNDVVAPENSTKNRTLDQQCTVTRPGLAPIAASMAVELMVALLHHPLQQRAHAPPNRTNTNYNPTCDDSPSAYSAGALGVMPHQIRGSLVSYQMMTPTVPSFGCCTGCSPLLVQAYRDNGLDLVYQVCQSTDSAFLEDLAGLTAFRADAADKLAAMDDDDDLWDEEE